jgi:multiple sugar transport system ATP-binding protein
MGRALVRDPRVFLFDEPLSNLDAKLRVDMRTEIKLMHQRMGVTVVYVTHDQIEAMTLATRIAVLKAGELQQLGSPQMVYDDPANTFVAGFMGSPSMNLVPGRVREHDGKLLAEIATGEDGTVALPFARDLDGLARYKDQEVIVGVRPEAITDTQSANRDEGVIHEADLRVEVTEPTGSDTFVVTALGGKEVVARMRVNAPAKAGQSCRFAFDVSRMVAFDRESEERIR